MLRWGEGVELVSWAKSDRMARVLAGKIRKSGYRPDLVIAIGRGGYVPARVVCDALPHDALTSMKIEHWGPGAEKKETTIVRYPVSIDIWGLDVLVIDDVTDTGETLEIAMEYLQGKNPRSLRTGVLQHKASSKLEPDYYAELITEWRWVTYPWALWEDLSVFVERVLDRGPLQQEEIAKELYSSCRVKIQSPALGEILEFLVDQKRIAFRDRKYEKSAASSGK